MPAPSQPGGFSLFPNTTSRPPSRSQSRPRTATPQEGQAALPEATPPRTGRRASVRRNSPSREGKQKPVSNNPWQHALDASKQQSATENAPGSYAVDAAAEDPVVETICSQPVADAPPRCETAFSEAKTLVRSSSQRSLNSIARPPATYAPAAASSSSSHPPAETSAEPAPAAIRSIFPRYNPDLPLDRQEYYPTQASPTHIPQAAISRPLYSPRSASAAAGSSSAGPRGPRGGTHANSHSVSSPSHRWPGQRHHEPAVISPVCTTEELRGLWKVTNGWRATSLEGRTYCLQMTAAPEAPTYSLSSSTGQPFYCLRVDPTSASAIVTLSRYDPNKPFKPASTNASSSQPAAASSSPTNGVNTPSPRPSSSSSRRPDLTAVAHTPATTSAKHVKNWQDVLVTNLEPASRKQPHPHGDGLVAELWPCAATRLAADRANDAATVALAQQESARLVWDADSGNHFLVHPALAVPFCVTVERTPAYSRTEYTLEHLESPAHLARLTRDGTGKGWLEVDTAVAAKVEAVYLVDVAVTALLLVAHTDEAFAARVGEVFEPPPTAAAAMPGGGGGGAARNGSAASLNNGAGGDGGSSRGSIKHWAARAAGVGSRQSRGGGGTKKEEREKKKKKKKKKGKNNNRPMEQFEMDLESQASDLKTEEKDKIPGLLRAAIGLFTITFKCLVWCVTLGFKAVMAILSGLTRCCGLGKL
ncbi:hypothetical protein VTK26DRAFT_218 [Humicola hyalothermophila]